LDADRIVNVAVSRTPGHVLIGTGPAGVTPDVKLWIDVGSPNVAAAGPLLEAYALDVFHW